MKERRCLKCLAPGHIASSCQNEKVCRHCKQRGHHQSICPTLSPCDSSETKRNQPEGDITNTTTTNTVRNKGTVLLQTAKGIAFNEDNSKSSHVRILFDNGSQRSYITSNLKSKLSWQVHWSVTAEYPLVCGLMLKMSLPWKFHDHFSFFAKTHCFEHADFKKLCRQFF